MQAVIDTILNFFDALIDYSEKVLDSLFTFVNDFILYIPRKIWEYIVDLIEYLLTCDICGSSNTLNLIVEYIQGFQVSGYGEVFQSVLWFMNIFHVSEGFRMLVCAFLLRFLIRRLPVFG